MLLALTAGATADAGGSGFDKKLEKLDEKVNSDLADGALTKPDGDELKLEISEARSVATSDPKLARGTRRNLQQKIAKINKELALKEKQATALGSANASSTP